MRKTSLLCLLASFFLLMSCSQKNKESSSDHSSQSQSETIESESESESESEEESSSESSSESESESESSSGSSESESEEELINLERSISLLPNTSQVLDIEGETTNGLNISIADEDMVDVVVRSKEQVAIVALKEGETTVEISNDEYRYIVSVESIDLRIVNEESYVQKGSQLQINLSKIVPVTFKIDNPRIAIVNEGGMITALREGVFTLTVTYKDNLTISKTFVSYIRMSEIDVFNRDNPLVHYLGRNYHENKIVRLDNEGSGFEVYFEGTSLTATMSGKNGSWYGYTMVSVLVDDEIDTTKRIVTLNKSSKEYEYTLVENLTPGFHRVRMLKRTENLSTYLTLHKLATDGTFHPVNSENKLKLEVYGDSITAGYGNLRGALNDQTSATLQSGLQTYAGYTALELGAEINIQARSGIGMYTANNDIGFGNHISDHYDKVNYDGEHHWNFDNYTPDVVIINVGANDYWDPTFNQQTFVTSYINTVTSLANIYGEETSFILLSGLMEQEVNSIIVGIKASLQQTIPNAIYSYQFSKCNAGHPLCSEHAKASDELIRLIKENHLDIIPEREEPEVIIPDSHAQYVNCGLNVELQDEIKSDSELYVYLPNGDKVKGTKVDNFNYQFSFENIEENDIEVYFTIDDNEEYKSNNYLIRTRKDYVDNIVLDTFLASPIEEEQGEQGWIVTNHLFDEEVVITDESNVTVTSANWLAGHVVRNANEGDNFRLSVKISFANAIADYTQTFAGLVPYYIDDSNFVVVYLQWDNNGDIRGIGCTGIIEGNDIGWNDFFSIVGFETDTAAGIDLSVVRNGTALRVECGGKFETKNIAGMSGDTEKVGVWGSCEGNPITYANFTQAHQDRIIDEEWKFTSHLFNGTMTVNPDSSVTLWNEQNWLAGFAVRETLYTDNYYISANIKCDSDAFTASQDITLGLVPYYVNDNNFVVVYLQWTAESKIKSIGCTGKINGTDLGWNDAWDFANLDSTLASGQTLKVTRSNTKLTIVFGGKTANINIAKLDGMENSYCGLYSNKTSTTFSNIVIASSI